MNYSIPKFQSLKVSSKTPRLTKFKNWSSQFWKFPMLQIPSCHSRHVAQSSWPRNKLALGPRAWGDPTPNFSWSWGMSHEPWGMNHEPRALSHEPLTTDNRSFNKWFAISYRFHQKISNNSDSHPCMAFCTALPVADHSRCNEETHVMIFTMLPVITDFKRTWPNRCAIVPLPFFSQQCINTGFFHLAQIA